MTRTCEYITVPRTVPPRPTLEDADDDWDARPDVLPAPDLLVVVTQGPGGVRYWRKGTQGGRWGDAGLR